MNGKSGLIIAFLILFIRSGLSQRFGSFGFQPSSTGFNPPGSGLQFGDSQFGSAGDNRGGGNRRITESSSWNSGSSFGSSKAEDNRKIPSSSGSSQWNIGSGWNSGVGPSGYQTGSAGTGNNHNGNNQGIGSGWNFGNQNEERNPTGKGHPSSNKEDNERKTGSKKPGFSSGGTNSELTFDYQNGDSKKPTGVSDSSFGFDAKRPQGSAGGSGSLSWGSGNQNEDRETGGSGFFSTKDENSQEKPNQSGWNSGAGDFARRPQGSSSIGSSSSSGFGSQSSFFKPQGTSGSSTGSSSWGSSSSSNSNRPQGSTGSGPNRGSGSNSNRPQGSSSGSSNWGSNSKRPEDISTSGSTNWGIGSGTSSNRPQGGISNGGSSGWSFDSDSKPQGSQNNWGSAPNSNSKKTQGSSSGGSGFGFPTSKKPDDDRNKPNSNQGDKKPSGRPGSANADFDKPAGSGKGSDKQKPSGSGNGNQKESIDWDSLEKENRQETIKFDLGELWHVNDRKDPAWMSIWTRNRFRRDADDFNRIPLNCQCTDHHACPMERRIDSVKFFKYYHRDLRVKMLECASAKKVCCVTREENDPIPACGGRISKLAEGDINKDYPWMVRLVAVGESGEETLCTASLIQNAIALTTATCALLLSGKDVRVRSGEWNTLGGFDRNQIEETTIGKVYLHPDFEVYAKDLAILYLNEPIHRVNKVCLPTHHDSLDKSKCVVVGWREKNDSGLKSVVLEKVDLERGKCPDADNARNDFNNPEDSEFWCAHAKENNLLLMDPAASVLCPVHNTRAFAQVGFVSNFPQMRNGKTSTFTDIHDSIDWVYRIYSFVIGEDGTE